MPCASLDRAPTRIRSDARSATPPSCTTGAATSTRRGRGRPRWWRSATSTASSRSSPWAPSCWPTSSPAPARASRELGAELARLQTGGVLTRRVLLAMLVAEAYRGAGQPDRGLDVLAGALKAVEAGAERQLRVRGPSAARRAPARRRPLRRGRRGVLPPRRRHRPGHRRSVVRAARGDQPGPAARRPRGPGRGALGAGAGAGRLHRGPRHARSADRQRPASRHRLRS